LREKLFSEVRYMILMYCWVIVEPPPEAVTSAGASPTRPSPARNRPEAETPGSVQKVRFSAATIASFTCCGIWAYGIVCRFCTWNEPSFVLPSL